jgi:hypothetical protein
MAPTIPPPQNTEKLSIRDKLRIQIDNSKLTSNNNHQATTSIISVYGLVISLIILVLSVIIVPLFVLFLAKPKPMIIPDAILKTKDPTIIQIYMLNNKASGTSFSEVTAFVSTIVAVAGTLIAVLGTSKSSGMTINPNDFRIVNDAFKSNRAPVEPKMVESDG